MSLFRTSLGPPPVLSDDAIARYGEALRRELQPDPLYRRRLRGMVLNRYVALREGSVRGVGVAGTMSRIGRAVLYASSVLAVSVTSVMAASQRALPGELLYPLKQRVEELRFEVLPAHLHDDLAAAALGERIDELAQLAVRGQVEHVVELALVIQHGYEELRATLEPDDAAAVERHLVVLNGLLGSVSFEARVAVADVVGDLAAPAAERDERRYDNRGVRLGRAADPPAGPERATLSAPAASGRPSPQHAPSPAAISLLAPVPSPTQVEASSPAPPPVESPVPTPAVEPSPRPTPRQPGEDRGRSVEATPAPSPAPGDQ